MGTETFDVCFRHELGIRGLSSIPTRGNFFFTCRNEVLAKVIFLHLSVILFTGGVPPNFQGVGGSSKFWGGCLQIFGGALQFWGVSSNFSGGFSNFRNTVNVQPVRILLECILVSKCYNPNLHNFARFDRIRLKTKNPNVDLWIESLLGPWTVTVRFVRYITSVSFLLSGK